MGVIKRGVLGGFSGKVANVVGTSWKGRAVMKALPLSVANPRTVGQTKQRNKLSMIVAIAQPILSRIIQPIWNKFSGNISGYNLFTRMNINGAFDEFGDLFFDKIVISPTDIAPASINVITVEGGQAGGSFTWNNTLTDSRQQNTDIANAVVIDNDGNVISVPYGTVPRIAGSWGGSFTRTVVTGEKLHYYLMFESADGKYTFGTAYKSVFVA